MYIYEVEEEQLTTIIEGLVKKGLLFKARPDGKGSWTIELTGGY